MGCGRSRGRWEGGAAGLGLLAALALAHPAAAEPDPVAHTRDSGPLGGAAKGLGRVARPVFDVAVQRPVEAVGLAAGALAFAPSYPVGWLFGAGDDVVRICLADPWRRVTRRPLGGL